MHRKKNKKLLLLDLFAKALTIVPVLSGSFRDSSVCGLHLTL
jgi:hypothetical protein